MTETYTFSIVSRHIGYPSCSYRGDTVEDITDDNGDVSLVAIEIARVIHARESMADCGGGGSIGGGDRELVLVVADDNGDEIEEINLLDGDMSWRERYPLPDGTVSPRTVSELSEPVWDGSNHSEPDVSDLAAMAGCRGVWGHLEAGEYLADYTPSPKDSAGSLVGDAADCGVHLDHDEVERWLEDNLPESDGDECEDD